MTSKVINDPSALGWEYDSETGRWSWGGGQGSSGDGGSFPEAPVDGEQYSRQDASWQVIVHPDVGGGGLEDAPADGAIYGRKNNDWAVVPTSGGGDGPDMSLYYTAAQCDTKFQPKGNYLTSGSLNGYATQAWVGNNYQPKGNYLTDFTESDPTVPAHVKGITQADINKWNNAGSSATPTLQQVTEAGASTSNSMTAPNYFTGGNAYTIGGTSSGGARAICSNGWTFTGSNSGALMTISSAGAVTATGDVTAYSDVRLKENIETLDGSKVYQMRGVSFTKDGRDGSGVIAQELQQIAPELVNEDGEYLSVAYGNIVGYLIEAVKELKAEVEELKRG